MDGSERSKGERVLVSGDKSQSFNGASYYLCGSYYSLQSIFKGSERLHRVVWEHYNGSIPKGMHIHHVDHDKSNNNIENLEMLTQSEHSKHHSNESWARELGIKYQHRTKEWHASDAGIKWHAEHYNKMKDKLHEKVVKNCENCGDSYEGVKRNGVSFCSKNCKSAHRRKSGVDDIERPCIKCGESFTTNKYGKRLNCGKCSRVK